MFTNATIKVNEETSKSNIDTSKNNITVISQPSPANRS